MKKSILFIFIVLFMSACDFKIEHKDDENNLNVEIINIETNKQNIEISVKLKNNNNEDEDIDYDDLYIVSNEKKYYANENFGELNIPANSELSKKFDFKIKESSNYIVFNIDDFNEKIFIEKNNIEEKKDSKIEKLIDKDDDISIKLLKNNIKKTNKNIKFNFELELKNKSNEIEDIDYDDIFLTDGSKKYYLDEINGEIEILPNKVKKKKFEINIPSTDMNIIKKLKLSIDDKIFNIK